MKQQLGWDPFFENQLSAEERQNAAIARIVEPLRGLSRVIYEGVEIWAEHTEKSATGDKTREAVPSIGDWVVGSLRDSREPEKRMRIHRILERKNKLSRAATGGKVYEQILCTNVDTAFLVIAITQGLNLASVGRYLEILNECNIPPVILVNKIDEVTSAASALEPLSEISKGIPLFPVSVKQRHGLDVISPYFSQGKTVVLLGASGAGKSTLVNYLLGTEVQRVDHVRESDQKGRHTTTGRRLHILPRGGMVIDSPGIREIQKWEEPVESLKPAKKAKPTKQPRRRRYSEDEDSDE